MLRISVIDGRTERRLVLEGKLIGPWVAELRKAWKAASVEIAGRALVVDVKERMRHQSRGRERSFGIDE
jgi:hypothetical protein